MYKLAATMLALSGIMHCVAVVLGKLTADVLPLALLAALYFLLAYFLSQQKRRAAWLIFIVMLIGISVALTSVNSGSYAPNWVFYSIALLDIVTAICLFFVLWRSKIAKRDTSNRQTESHN